MARRRFANKSLTNYRPCRITKLRHSSESTRTHSGDTHEGQIRVIRTKSGQRRYDVDAYLGESATPPSSATVESAAPSKGDLKGRSLSCGKDTLKPKPRYRRRTQLEAKRTCLPTGARGSELWLPIETGFRFLSWFSTTRTTAPNRNSPRIFSPSSTPSLAGFRPAPLPQRNIRVYPTREQRRILRLWFDGPVVLQRDRCPAESRPGTQGQLESTED